MNSAPYLQVAWNEILCFANMWCRKGLVISGASTLSCVGTEISCLVAWSTILRIAMWPFDSRGCSIRSKDIEYHGCREISNCWMGLNGWDDMHLGNCAGHRYGSYHFQTGNQGHTMCIWNQAYLFLNVFILFLYIQFIMLREYLSYMFERMQCFTLGCLGLKLCVLQVICMRQGMECYGHLFSSNEFTVISPCMCKNQLVMLTELRVL